MAFQAALGRAATYAAGKAGQAYMTHKIGQHYAYHPSMNGGQGSESINGGLRVNPNANRKQFQPSAADRIAIAWHSGRNEAGRPLDYSSGSLPTFAPEKDIDVPRLKFPA